MSSVETSGCPVSHPSGHAALASRFDPFHDPYLADPYPLLAEAREKEPVFYSPELDYWVVTRYADIEAVFKDPDTFSARIAQAPIAPLAPSVVQLLKDARFAPEPVMSNCDRPKHTRIRRHTARAFTSNKIAVLEPFIRALTNGCIDAFESRGEVDLVAEMLYDLPAVVILKILGIPDADVPKIKSWSANRLMLTWGRLGEAEQRREAQGLLEYWRYCEAHIAAKINAPGDDFPSDLLAIRNGDDAVLTIPEITNIVFGLLIAGHETTTSSSANAVKTLLEQRHAWERLCREPALIPAAVEELLRVNTSVISWRRQTNRPVSIAGIDIPEGAKLLLMLASANHDAAVFPEPERLDLDRANARDHLSFGLGIHFCFGAPLARLELKVILEQLTARLPGLRLLEEQAWRYHPNTSFRGPISLGVRW